MRDEGEFGRLLRRLRRERDLTQEALAQAAFCAVDTVKKLEGGRRRPSRQMAAQLARVLALDEVERAAFLAVALAGADPEEDNTLPDARSAAGTTALPSPITRLIGRAAELAAVGALLASPAVRLLTLTGPGGVGKTRLALQSAAQAQDAYTDGVWFIDLAPLREPAQVVAAVAETLGVHVGGTRPAVARLGEHLRDRQTLLILDNFEHVLDAASDVGALLAAAPGLKVLATSRAALRLQGEWDYALPPLSEAEAQELFVERARAVKAGFTLGPDNAAAVAAICARLDGLPLAIELAAARVRLLAPQHLLGQLDQRLHVLTGGPRDAPSRQRTLRDTVAWSYDLLGAEAQALFKRLGVFVGGCTLAAAEAVAGEPTSLRVLDVLEALVDAHLLVQVDGADEPRFRMLETIREYALERLEADGEADATRRRHADYAAALAETAEPHLYGAKQGEWLRRLEVDHDNLRAALAWAVDHERTLGLRLAGALGWFWHLHGHHREGRDWLLRALDGGDVVDEADARRAQAKALNQAGYLAMFLRDMKQANALLDESVALWRTVGDSLGLAHALCDWGGCLGEYSSAGRAKARELLEESIALFHSLGARQNLPRVYFWHGYITALQGDIAAARASAEECNRLGREVGDFSSVGTSNGVFAHIAFQQGDYAAAQSYYEHALPLGRNVADRPGIALGLGFLGSLLYLQGQYAQVRPVLEERLQIWRELDNQHGVAWGLYPLGYLALRQNDRREATSQLVESLALFRDLGETDGMTRCVAGLAEVAGAEGQFERSARLVAASLALREARDTSYNPQSGFPLTRQADLERQMVELRAALGEAAFEAAWAAGRAMSLEQAIAEALCSADHSPGESSVRGSL